MTRESLLKWEGIRGRLVEKEQSVQIFAYSRSEKEKPALCKD